MRFRAELALLLILAACATSRSPRGRPSAADYPVKLGQPYQVQGRWYYPKDDQKYDEVGMASWYGPGFHGLTTANGEPYDMDGMTAAHKTLPLPSYVEVTNLANGQRQIVRVNDRGPFVSGRIIDLSRRSAAALGVQRAGVAKVRVRRVYPPEDVRMALRSGRSVQLASMTGTPPRPLPPVPSATIPTAPVLPPNAVVVAPSPVAGTPLQPPVQAPIQTVDLPASSVPPVAVAPASPGPSPVTVVPTVPVGATIYIQVAAVSDPGKAAWLVGYLKPFGPPSAQPSGTGLTRVRLGPFADRQSASEVLAKLRAAGYQEAMIVAVPPAG